MSPDKQSVKRCGAFWKSKLNIFEHFSSLFSMKVHVRNWNMINNQRPSRSHEVWRRWSLWFTLKAQTSVSARWEEEEEKEQEHFFPPGELKWLFCIKVWSERVDDCILRILASRRESRLGLMVKLEFEDRIYYNMNEVVGMGKIIWQVELKHMEIRWRPEEPTGRLLSRGSQIPDWSFSCSIERRSDRNLKRTFPYLLPGIWFASLWSV